MTGPALTFDHVHKRYRELHRSQRGRLLNRSIGRGAVAALSDTTLTVAAGETFGLVGVNGSGKSTFLRLAAGVTAPTEGTVTRSGGRVGAILSLGEGFHPLLTGRENALTGAMLAGMTRREAAQRMPAILEFSELGDAVDDPLRTYSSGMFVRLAFAVAAHVDADLLLVDEALAVGDLAFSQKCLRHLEELRAASTTIVLASHDLGVVRDLCDRVAWFRQGSVQMIGSPNDVVDRYEQAMYEHTLALTPPERATAGTIGTGEAVISDLTVSDPNGAPISRLIAGRPVRFNLAVSSQIDVDRAVVGLSLHSEAGEKCLDLSTPVALSGGQTLSLSLSVDRLDLAAGNYHLDVGAYAPDWDHAYDYQWQAGWITVAGDSSAGLLTPPHRWEHHQ